MLYFAILNELAEFLLIFYKSLDILKITEHMAFIVHRMEISVDYEVYLIVLSLN